MPLDTPTREGAAASARLASALLGSALALTILLALGVLLVSRPVFGVLAIGMCLTAALLVLAVRWHRGIRSGWFRPVSFLVAGVSVAALDLGLIWLITNIFWR